MKNYEPVGPIGQDFEDLVDHLPWWAVNAYGPSIDAINRVRKALREYESNSKSDTRSTVSFDKVTAPV